MLALSLFVMVNSISTLSTLITDKLGFATGNNTNVLNNFVTYSLAVLGLVPLGSA